MDKEHNKVHCLLKVKIEKFDLGKLIDTIKNNYSSEIFGQYSPVLFHKEQSGDIYVDMNMYGFDETLSTSKTINFLYENEDALVYLDFAIDNIEEIIEFGDGSRAIKDSVHIGDMVFTEDNSYGISIEKSDGNYIFNEVDHTACSGNSEAKIRNLKDGKELKEKLIEFLNSFIK